MNSIYPTIADRQLRHIITPGSHNAGMSEINSAWFGGSVEGNTRTQLLRICDQLRVGSLTCAS